MPAKRSIRMSFGKQRRKITTELLLVIEDNRVRFDVVSRMTILTNFGHMLFAHDRLRLGLVKRAASRASGFLVGGVIKHVSRILCSVADNQQRVSTRFT